MTASYPSDLHPCAILSPTPHHQSQRKKPPETGSCTNVVHSPAPVVLCLDSAPGHCLHLHPIHYTPPVINGIVSCRPSMCHRLEPPPVVWLLIPLFCSLFLRVPYISRVFLYSCLLHPLCMDVLKWARRIAASSLNIDFHLFPSIPLSDVPRLPSTGSPLNCIFPARPAGY